MICQIPPIQPQLSYHAQPASQPAAAAAAQPPPPPAPSQVSEARVLFNILSRPPQRGTVSILN